MTGEVPTDAGNATRYLELLKRSLLNELYLENEVRLLYVFSRLVAGRGVDGAAVRDIARREPELLERIRRARVDGRPWWTVRVPDPEREGANRTVNLRNVCEFSHTMIGRRRLENIEHCLDRVRADAVPGDLIETGVWRGGATVFMAGYLAAHAMHGRTVWVADSFAGLPVPSRPEDAGYDLSAERVPVLAVPRAEVEALFERYGLLDERVRLLEGWFRETLPSAPIERLALLRLDGDLYESTMDALEALYQRVSPGGFVIVDDYGDFEPCRRATDEFRARHRIETPIETIDWAGVYWRKDARAERTL